MLLVQLLGIKKYFFIYCILFWPSTSKHTEFLWSKIKLAEIKLSSNELAIKIENENSLLATTRWSMQILLSEKNLCEPRSAIDKKNIRSRKKNLEHKNFKFVLISFTRILARAIAEKEEKNLHIEWIKLIFSAGNYCYNVHCLQNIGFCCFKPWENVLPALFFFVDFRLIWEWIES